LEHGPTIIATAVTAVSKHVVDILITECISHPQSPQLQQQIPNLMVPSIPVINEVIEDNIIGDTTEDETFEEKDEDKETRGSIFRKKPLRFTKSGHWLVRRLQGKINC
jgi:hypothetical protein